MADHLARQRHADLFLDTLPYNAHTTASDALWAGVPVLTCLGATFAGRVAASLLKAVGLDELITHSLHDYEALARRLAGEESVPRGAQGAAGAQPRRFLCLIPSAPTRHIEAAYVTMWQRYQRGRAAATFVGASRSDRTRYEPFNLTAAAQVGLDQELGIVFERAR